MLSAADGRFRKETEQDKQEGGRIVAAATGGKPVILSFKGGGNMVYSREAPRMLVLGSVVIACPGSNRHAGESQVLGHAFGGIAIAAGQPLLLSHESEPLLIPKMRSWRTAV